MHSFHMICEYFQIWCVQQRGGDFRSWLGTIGFHVFISSPSITKTWYGITLLWAPKHIVKKYLGLKFFWTIQIWVGNFFVKKKFGWKIFGSKKIWSEILLGPKEFVSEFFLCQTKIWSEIFSVPKKIWSEIFYKVKQLNFGP